MDTEKSVEERVQALVDRVNDRKYFGRRMIVDIHTHSDDLKTFTVKGKLKLSVSETPDEKESWIRKDYSVMITETDPDMAIAEVFAHLNSIPMEYGDTIFEEDFEEVIKLMEGIDGQAKITQEETPIQ